MRTSELQGGGDVTIPSQHVFSLTIVFFLRVRSRMLCAQWTCRILRTRLSHTPVSRVMCHRLVYSYVPIPVSRVSLPVQMWTVDSSPATCLSSDSPFVLLTRTLMFLAYVFLPSTRQLVYLRFLVYVFLPLSCRLVYAYRYCLCLSLL